MKHNPLGKNNFDRLEAAGLVAGADDSENMKAKTEARVSELNTLVTKIRKVEAYLAELYVLPKPRQLKRLAAAAQGLKELHQQKLPVGAKKHVEACLNEVISLREGVYSSNSRMDKQTLALTASVKARKELTAMVESAQHRLEKVVADSSSELDMEEFYKKAADVIKKNDAESAKVLPLRDKAFLLERVPVVPLGSSLSTEKLPQLGFKSESLGGYPIIHNQLVLGINPKRLASHGDAESQRFAELQQKLKESGVSLDEIKKIHGKIKDLTLDISRLDPEKADKEYVAKKNADLNRLHEEASRLIQKSGIDPAEYQSLQQKLRRSHSAVIPAVREEAERIRKLLEKKKNVKLRFVSETPHSDKKSGGIWFWLMPDKELDMLAKASHTKRVDVKQWGFAFS
jgi:hypothetical protein